MIMTEKTDSSVQKFFEGRAGSLRLFKLLRRMVKTVCSPSVEVSRTQISFGEHYKYLWVWLPQIWITKRPEDSITLTIMTGEKLKSSRISESTQPRKGYWTHHILIQNEGDIDNTLRDLIRKSYEFYLKRLKKKNLHLKKRKAGT